MSSRWDAARRTGQAVRRVDREARRQLASRAVYATGVLRQRVPGLQWPAGRRKRHFCQMSRNTDLDQQVEGTRAPDTAGVRLDPWEPHRRLPLPIGPDGLGLAGHVGPLSAAPFATGDGSTDRHAAAVCGEAVPGGGGTVSRCSIRGVTGSRIRRAPSPAASTRSADQGARGAPPRSCRPRWRSWPSSHRRSRRGRRARCSLLRRRRRAAIAAVPGWSSSAIVSTGISR